VDGSGDLCRTDPALPICHLGPTSIPSPVPLPTGTGRPVPSGSPTPPTTSPGLPPLPVPTDRNGAAHDSHLGGLFNVDDGYGNGLNNYDIFGKTGTFDLLGSLWLVLANIGFAIGKYAVGVSVWMQEFAMSSDVVGWIRGPAQTLEQLWQAELIG